MFLPEESVRLAVELGLQEQFATVRPRARDALSAHRQPTGAGGAGRRPPTAATACSASSLRVQLQHPPPCRSRKPAKLAESSKAGAEKAIGFVEVATCTSCWQLGAGQQPSISVRRAFIRAKDGDATTAFLGNGNGNARQDRDGVLIQNATIPVVEKNKSRHTTRKCTLHSFFSTLRKAENHDLDWMTVVANRDSSPS
ncbi:hypothetical protein PHYPSEUDO_009093 [Phytophthora pseudosyringae]|uniref:Uncharacterized protein n=1 Tax=Phytophthora pseudosyringae TaxID=221518 RepID=A0A8T1VDC6_9STRA|nr:hypothetical protein PHYPSEUDO_009093 [Phytophthora pseudosyringae]